MLPLVRAGTPAADRLLAKLNGRLAAMEALDTAPYRVRVKKLFGKALAPGDVVARILQDVRAKGDRALFDYAHRIDGVKLNARTLRVSPKEIKAGYQRTPKEVRDALKLTAHRIAEYQQMILPSHVPPQSGCCGPEGVRVGLAWSPLRRAGLYVPGGTAAYPSSVLHNALPAMVAGVKELAIATPCGPDGKVSDGVLAACEILGLGEVYRIGGAQAIGALAYGTASIKRVDKIVGPGNLFVMLAKRAVFGHVDIDMLAGPSEVLILADKTANPAWVAADLLAQAEHDVLASCVLLTDSLKVATAVQAEVMRQLATLPRREIADAAIRDWGAVVVTQDLKAAVALANELAPEHLEIHTAKPEKRISELRTAGAIFLGPHATEPLGDYLAGPSHTLPTGGTARAFSGVSVYTFLRRTSLIAADAKGLKALAPAIEALARAEGLEAHRRAVAVRNQ
ncbi:MAG: histidinol dehydrogenase [Planctomycetes bacterium]|nr:histidinol dehydrogenase [Planctomycetota bacterium]